MTDKEFRRWQDRQDELQREEEAKARRAADVQRILAEKLSARRDAKLKRLGVDRELADMDFSDLLV